eukprot:Gb_05988 [translate_table: standard]
MEIPIYSFEGTMELYEWFQWLEEYFDYANIQNEQDKTLTVALHLTGQAYASVRRNYEYWTPNFPWDTLKNFKEELEFEEKWNYKERKALELEYEEDAWGVEDDDSEFETVNIEFKVGKYMEEKIGKEELMEINEGTITVNTTKLDLVNDKQDVNPSCEEIVIQPNQETQSNPAFINSAQGNITPLNVQLKGKLVESTQETMSRRTPSLVSSYDYNFVTFEEKKSGIGAGDMDFNLVSYCKQWKGKEEPNLSHHSDEITDLEINIYEDVTRYYETRYGSRNTMRKVSKKFKHLNKNGRNADRNEKTRFLDEKIKRKGRSVEKELKRSLFGDKFFGAIHYCSSSWKNGEGFRSPGTNFLILYFGHSHEHSISTGLCYHYEKMQPGERTQIQRQNTNSDSNKSLHRSKGDLRRCNGNGNANTGI